MQESDQLDRTGVAGLPLRPGNTASAKAVTHYLEAVVDSYLISKVPEKCQIDDWRTGPRRCQLVDPPRLLVSAPPLAPSDERFSKIMQDAA